MLEKRTAQWKPTKGEKQQLKKILFALAERDITVSVVDAPPTTCLTACSRQRPQPVSSSSGPHYRHHHQLYRREVQQHMTRQKFQFRSNAEKINLVRASGNDEGWVTVIKFFFCSYSPHHSSLWPAFHHLIKPFGWSLKFEYCQLYIIDE